MKNLPATIEEKGFSLQPANMEEALKYADIIAKSDFVPKDFKNKPGNVLVAVQWGAELGVQPMQALQNIAVINGRPSIYGDLLLAVCKASPLCEYITETFDDDDMTATCKVKRQGAPEAEQKYSQKDAAAAGLWSKSGPWKQYPKRMLQMRARGFALRDAFPDLIKGIITREEAQDIPTSAPDPQVVEAEIVPAPKKSTGTAKAKDALKKVKKKKDPEPVVIVGDDKDSFICSRSGKATTVDVCDDFECDTKSGCTVYVEKAGELEAIKDQETDEQVDDETGQVVDCNLWDLDQVEERLKKCRHPKEVVNWSKKHEIEIRTCFDDESIKYVGDRCRHYMAKLEG